METRRPAVERARQRVGAPGRSRAPLRERQRVPSSVFPEALSRFRRQRPGTRRYRWASPNRYNSLMKAGWGRHEKKIPPLQLTPAYRAQLEFKGTVLCRGSGVVEVVERAVSKSVPSLTGDRGFESGSLQQRVQNLVGP